LRERSDSDSPREPERFPGWVTVGNVVSRGGDTLYLFELSRKQNDYYYRDVHGAAPGKGSPFSGAK